ncbi:hypothetical protein C1H46_000881 [Malus baccata]|uniref:Uncharacterized protein n=1 Tax=Malus baccata TaxID=106549 RepID=A0A540NSL1_MALBA|nr:hypothetical protein C1H46_000881 [Malus baccata]
MQQQQQQQQTIAQNSNGDPSSVQAAATQIAASNGVASVNNALNTASTSTSASTIVGLLQNSMNSRQQSSMNNANSPYGGSSVQIPSPGSSSTIPQTQPNPSPFQSPTPSSNNPSQTSQGVMTAGNHMGVANSPANISMQQPTLSGEADPSDSQSSVQKILHEMMMSNQLSGAGGMVGAGSLGNDLKNMNGILSTSNNTGLNGMTNNNSGIGGAGFGSMGGGLGQQPSMANGIRAAMGNNSVMNGRVGMASMAREQSMHHQQQDMGNQLLSGLGAVNGFNNLQFDWKHSP